jgi:hypothetical protein
MLYAEEKVRQMARSLLPSKNREAARSARVSIHRAARREVHLELAAWLQRGDPDADLAPLAPWERKEVSQAVDWRRWGDKVNPFIRWATARTRDLPREDRLGHAKGLLPRGLIGDHALDHLKRTRGFEPPHEKQWRLIRWSRVGRDPRMDPGEQAQLLRALILEPDGQRTFNRFLRERGVLTRGVKAPESATHRPRRKPAPRPLQGLHDVRPFLESLRPKPGSAHFTDWSTHSPAHWVEQFLQRFKQHRQRVAPLVAQLMAEGLLTKEPPRHERLQAGLARKVHAR